MSSPNRTVLRNSRFQLIGVVSLLFAAAMIAVLVVVIISPGQSFDHPGGFTPAGRAVAAVGCALAASALAAYGVSGLRVALILDQAGLVIRNPWSTAKIGWTSAPKFEVRDRRQEVSIASPAGGSQPRVQSQTTYRYREIVCVADRKRIWIAATSRMRPGGGVDELLTELRTARGRYGTT